MPGEGRWVSMKVLLAGITGLLTWSLSIVFIPVGQVTSHNTPPSCGLHDKANHVVQRQIKEGILFQIYNDGQAMWVHLTPQWGNLDNTEKTLLYHSLVCLAQEQALPLYVLPSEDA